LECRFKFSALNNGAVFILVDPQIALSCYAASSQTYLLQEAFNGNDAMGCLKWRPY
jgi:hypothetical protein